MSIHVQLITINGLLVTLSGLFVTISRRFNFLLITISGQLVTIKGLSVKPILIHIGLGNFQEIALRVCNARMFNFIMFI